MFKFAGAEDGFNGVGWTILDVRFWLSLLMVVLGGIGNVWGGVIGAIVVSIAYDQTKDLIFIFMDRPIVIQPLVFGLSMVLLVLFMPRGIGGWIEGFRRNRRFIRRSEERLSGTARNS